MPPRRPKPGQGKRARGITHVAWLREPNNAALRNHALTQHFPALKAISCKLCGEFSVPWLPSLLTSH